MESRDRWRCIWDEWTEVRINSYCISTNLQVGEIDEYSQELRYQVRRSTRNSAKPVEFKAHEFAAPLAPVKKDEIKSEEEENDDQTIIIDNDIPFR